MPCDLVTLTVEEDLATIRFERPDHGNQVTFAMLNHFIEKLNDANAADVDLLLLEGAGSDFCVGRDQSEDLSHVSWDTVISSILDANDLLTSFEGISIAAVTGRATGFGCGLAVQSDLTIAADTAIFGFDEIKHGIAPKIVLSYLETYVARKAALDLILTGRNINARTAKDLGLVSRVIPDDQFNVGIARLIEVLAGYDPAALTEIKFFLRDIETVDPQDRRGVIIDRMT